MTLDQISIKEKVRIVKMEVTKKEKRRLFEIGLIEDGELIVLHKALFNDPIEIEVAGYRLVIRYVLANKIEVRKEQIWKSL